MDHLVICPDGKTRIQSEDKVFSADRFPRLYVLVNGLKIYGWGSHNIYGQATFCPYANDRNRRLIETVEQKMEEALNDYRPVRSP